MATVAGSTEHGNTFSLEGLTYKQAASKVFRNLAAWDTRFTTLKTALEKTPAQIKEIALQHIASKDIGALTTLLNTSYEYYRIVLEEQEAALGVLHPLDAQFKEAIAYCTPTNVSLQPEQLKDLTKHGFDMRSYPSKELALAESSNALLIESIKIQAAIQNIGVFITTCPYAMNGAARAVKQATRDKTWGDMLPEKCVGGTKYFTEGFQAFQKLNPKSETTATEVSNTTLKTTERSEETESLTTPSSTDVLGTLTEIIDQESR
jgi:hypothetical protein